MSTDERLKIIVQGGGDLATGVALRLYRAGWKVLITELPKPVAVRRGVSFCQAVYQGEMDVEGVKARLVHSLTEIEDAFIKGDIPVIVDPQAAIRYEFDPDVLVDSRMRKSYSDLDIHAAPFVIGLGPGFQAGKNCAVVVETNRGPRLGRVYWEGCAQEDTGVPERVGAYSDERVLRAPCDGVIHLITEIGQQVQQGEILAQIDGKDVVAPFNGVIRGLLQEGIPVTKGMKIGDVDPRGDPSLCWLVSEKALAIAGGVLEAILTWKAQKRI